MHGCYLITLLPSISDLISIFDKTALTFSGLCHDVSHTAHNNAFEMSSFSKLAIRYNDKSVLENHHLTTTFKILQLPNCNIFEKMDKSEFLSLRKSMISNILSTDMRDHFTILHNFEVKLKEYAGQKEKLRIYHIFSIIFCNILYIFPINSHFPLEKVQNDPEKLATFGMLIHCSDFFGNIKPFDVSKDWSTRVNKEFSQQVLDFP